MCAVYIHVDTWFAILVVTVSHLQKIIAWPLFQINLSQSDDSDNFCVPNNHNINSCSETINSSVDLLLGPRLINESLKIVCAACKWRNRDVLLKVFHESCAAFRKYRYNFSLWLWMRTYRKATSVTQSSCQEIPLLQLWRRYWYRFAMALSS